MQQIFKSDYEHEDMVQQKSLLLFEPVCNRMQQPEADHNNNNNLMNACSKRFHKSRSVDDELLDKINDEALDNNLFYGSLKNLKELEGIKKRNPDTYCGKLQLLNTRFFFKFKRNCSHKKRERLIRKNGDSNITRMRIQSRGRKYCLDIFNTLINLRLIILMSIFILAFLASWLVFALFWYLLQMYHATSMQCVSNMDVGDWTSAILFSIETQQTIGYGNRYIDNRCKSAVVLVMVQSMVSVLLQSFMCGIVFAKLSRPKKRTETLIFSKKAVVAVRDGVHCLMMRVGDMRKSHIIQTNVRMFLIRTRYTAEGEVIPWNAQELELGNRLKSSNNLLFMPIVVEHLITKDSPMWDLVEKSVTDDDQHVAPIGFKNEDFEIVVVLEGIVETTGATTQARTSYTPTEIQWNHIFEPLVDCRLNKATIDYSKFDRTINLQVNPKRVDIKDAAGLVVENVINETTDDCSTRKKYPIRQSENINRAFDVYSSGNTNSTIRNSIEFV